MDKATTRIYTLSLHDALPIYDGHAAIASGTNDDDGFGVGRTKRRRCQAENAEVDGAGGNGVLAVGRTFERDHLEDRKSTRLNSSHANISYAVFCLKKKKKIIT